MIRSYYSNSSFENSLPFPELLVLSETPLGPLSWLPELLVLSDTPLGPLSWLPRLFDYDWPFFSTMLLAPDEYHAWSQASCSAVALVPPVALLCWVDHPDPKNRKR